MLPQARPHVVLARLNDEELEIYNWLLRSVAGVGYSRNRSKAFRTFLRRMAKYVSAREQKAKDLKENYLKYLQDSSWPDFESPVATKGPKEIEVGGPEEVEILEEMERC